jgi:hypothetical protein
MSGDSRLRLLGGSTAHQLDTHPALEALDATRIVLRAGPNVQGPHAAAFAATIAILARLFPHVAVEPRVDLGSNWWDARNTDHLLDLLAPVRATASAAATTTITLGFGSPEVAADWFVGGGDYVARVGRAPQTLADDPRHSLGVHAASCLVVSQVLLQVLAPYGFVGVPINGDVVFNLVDYKLTEGPALDLVVPPTPGLRLAVAGVGSVGSSALALLSMAVDSSSGHLATGGRLAVIPIDHDAFDPTRNPFRYPALLGSETANKAQHMADRLRRHGLDAEPSPTSVATWAQQQDRPGFDGLLLSSVDTVEGRQDVTDVLARGTLSIGVDGLVLHAQREAFADGYACPYCDYVDASPASTQADVYANVTGLQVPRVLALLADSSRLTDADVDAAIAAGRLDPERRTALIGAGLHDLVRQAYAEVTLKGPEGYDTDVIAVAAPQVSWFAGVLAAAEIVKQLVGLPLLDRRVDFDLSGVPAGLVRRLPRDSTGRCLCHSGVRARWYRDLYDAS